MEWEMDGVSIEPEEMFQVLKHYPLPLGVIIFGADSKLKADVYETFCRHLGEPLAFKRKSIEGYIGQIRASFHKGCPVIVCLHGNNCLASERQSISRRFKKLGARTLVGVYAKAYRSDAIDFDATDSESGFSYRDYYRQIESLSNDPPAYDLFLCFITVESSHDDESTLGLTEK